MDREPHLFATDRYEDITPQLRECARKLGPGGVKLASFVSMADTLPAFQIGTSKVDTGSPKEYRDLEQEIANAQKQFPLDSERNCVALMDRLMCAEMSWHKGFSQLQTLLSCIAIEKDLLHISQLKFAYGSNELELLRKQMSGQAGTGESEDLVAYFNSWQQIEGPRAFVLPFLWATVRAMSTCINLAEKYADTVFPEEDFHATRYGMYMLEDTPIQQIIELLEQARKRAAQLNFSQIAERLALRVSWLTVLKQGIPRKLANVERLKQQIEVWNPVIAGGETASTEVDAAEVDAWFSTGCQGRLDMACLRQHPAPVDGAETKKFWLRIARAIEQFAPVHKVERSSDLLAFYLAFSSRREPALVRMMARSLFTDSQVLSNSAKHWALLDIQETMPPPGLPSSTRAIDSFLSKAALCYTDLLNVFCQNRCRLREGLNALVVSFDSLQVVAEPVDKLIHRLQTQQSAASAPAPASGEAVGPHYLSSWTYFRKLQVMLWSILLTFETEVLEYGEMAYTGYYAFRLCQLLLTQLGQMRSLFEHQGNGARDSPGYSFLVALELESQMLSQLCTAQYMLWMALHKLSPPRPKANVSPEMQFRLRFQAFESVGVPEMLQYSDYSTLFDQVDVTFALQAAGNAAQSVRSLISTLGGLATENIEIPLLQRSAVGFSVAVATTVKLGSQPIKVDIDRDNFHWYFPVPKISAHKGE